MDKRTAEEWADWLLAQDLPSTRDTSRQLLGLLETQVPTYQAMSDEIREDPVLALKLLARANTALNAKDTMAKTLSHALSLLGTDFLRTLLASIQVEDSSASDEARRFHQRMGRSFVAAHFARWLARHRFPSKQEECFWAALFRGIPHWYLARMIDDADQPPADLRGRARRDWQRAHWGADEEAIWRAMIPRLGMPELVLRARLPESRSELEPWLRLSRLCPEQGPPPKLQDRRLALLANAPETLIVLAHWLESEIHRSWLSPVTEKLFRIAAVVTGLTLDDVISGIHAAAVNAAHAHDNPGAAQPARLLVAEQHEPVPSVAAGQAPEPRTAQAETEASQRRQAPKPEPPAPAPPSPAADAAILDVSPAAKARQTRHDTGIAVRKAKPAPEAEDSAPPPPHKPLTGVQGSVLRTRRGNDKLYEDITHMMFQLPHKFENAAALMNAACQCIVHGIGLHTTMIALCNTDKTRLKSYYSLGFRHRIAFRDWQFPLQGQTLFDRLMASPSGIWIRPDSSPKVWSSLPESFRDMMNTNQCFLMSVFVNKKAIALVYADDGTEHPHLTDADYARFKHVCAGISQVLHYFAMRRKRARTRHGKPTPG